MPKAPREGIVAPIVGTLIGDITLSTVFGGVVDGLSGGRWYRWKREREVLQVLRGLSRQRVWVIFGPERKWMIENAVKRDDDTDAALATAIMRGWIEPLQHSISWHDTDYVMASKDLAGGDRNEQLYRLTESGWAALNRSHVWTLVNTLLAAGAIAATFMLAR